MADDAALWGDPDVLVTREELVAAQAALKTYDDVLRTPLLRSWPVGGTRMGLKLESLQTTGSFKIRGMRYKLHAADVGRLRASGVVTMSAGNAGKAVAYVASQLGLDAKVFMPATAPDDRKVLMESLGATVHKVPGERLLDAVAASVADERRVLVHPFDDADLIRGHASCGLEILEDAPDADVVVVCCGGGGLLAGVAAAVKLSASSNARVVGVEPDGAKSMALSVAAGAAQWCPDGGKTDTIAHGLAPPSGSPASVRPFPRETSRGARVRRFAGRACYAHVRAFCDEIVTVTDEEMRHATRALYDAGVLAEVSGAAAVAAVLAGKVSGANVVATVSGRNIDVGELEHALSTRPMAHS